jgi:hypothetical protein
LTGTDGSDRSALFRASGDYLQASEAGWPNCQNSRNAEKHGNCGQGQSFSAMWPQLRRNEAAGTLSQSFLFERGL